MAGNTTGQGSSSPSRSSRPIILCPTPARAFHAKERYSYVWVCLGEPLHDIPDLRQEGDPAFRRIHQFDELWNCSALRMMENSFDNAHFSFVHKGKFGDIGQRKAEKYELTETPYGFVAETSCR